MSSREICSLTLKIAGICVWIQCLGYLRFIYGWGLQLGTELGLVGLFLLIGAVLLFGSHRLAGKIAAGASESGQPANTFEEKQAIAYSVVGLYLVLITLVRVGWLALAYLPAPYTVAPRPDAFAVTLLTSGLGLALGLWLFFRSRGLFVLFRKFQGLGLEAWRLDQEGGRPEPDRMQVVAFSVVGLYFLTSGLDGLLRWPDGYLFAMGLDYSVASLWQGLALLIGRIAFGVVVFARSTRLAAWWQEIQQKTMRPVGA